MKQHRWLAALMVVTICVITGFQIYWLKQSYTRESRSLEIRTNMLFRRTVTKLQATKLQLDSAMSGSLRFRLDSRQPGNLRRENMVEMIGVLHDRLRIQNPPPGDSSLVENTDSSRRRQIVELLSGMDALQDTLTIAEITSTYKAAMQEEDLLVPFTVLRLDSFSRSPGPAYNEVTIGFNEPITYRLELGNSFPFILKRLTAPLLFSLFLVGVTILSFVLLYRNILRQRRLAAIKNEFISNITHELKTPIATVGVAIEALKNFNAMKDPERTREYLDISSGELQRLSQLVDKVLRFSQFEKKEIELNLERVDISSLVQEVLSTMRPQLESRNAQVSVEISGDSTLDGDKLHLLSVIYNLVDNALKYSRDTTDIRISLNEDDDSVVLRVADKGIGIPKEYRDRIFEKFFRVPTGNMHDAKGYGLGLSYSAHVVKSHGGTIEVESKTGEGSIFTIRLPKKR